MANRSFRTAGTKGTTDETGLMSVSVPWYAASEEEVLTVGATPPHGLKEVGRDWDDIEGLEGFNVTVNYEGFEDGKDEDDGEQIEFDPSFSEEPIESHPSFLVLKERYGGRLVDGKIEWDETLGGSDDPLSSSGEERKNPLFGIKTYLALKSVFRRTYTRRNLPNDILDNIGEIVESLPEGFPTPSGRNWLSLPPKVSLRGNVYQISEELILSPVGGKWPAGVHGLIET